MTPDYAAAPETNSVRLDGIHKWYGRTHALAGASLSCRPGEVHTLLGENGSGKSTLVKVLSGVVRPDEGRVHLGNQPIERFSPSEAQRHGVATVYQEVLVSPNRSVAANVLLGHTGWFKWPASRAVRDQRVSQVLRHLIGADVDPRMPVERLSLMRQHQVAVARALIGEPDVLILDESTAALDLDGRDLLFEVVHELTDQRKTVIFISHRLDEVMKISDRVTVLKSGRVVDTLQREELDSRRLLTLMSDPATAAGGL